MRDECIVMPKYNVSRTKDGLRLGMDVLIDCGAEIAGPVQSLQPVTFLAVVKPQMPGTT